MRCISALLLCLPMLAADIPIVSNAIYVDFARALPWASANNQWIYSPIEPDEGACFSVWNNNPTSAHTLTISAWGSFDQRANTFAGFHWNQLPVFRGNGITASQSGVTATTLTIQPLASVVVYYRAGGGSRLAFQIAGAAAQAGTPDTLDVLMSRANNSGVCGNISLVSQARNSCSNQVAGTIGTTVTQIVAPSSSGGIHVCSVVINNTSAANTMVTFYQSQGATNTAISGNIPSNAGTLTPLQTQYGALYATPLGWSFAGSAGTPVPMTVTYAVF